MENCSHHGIEKCVLLLYKAEGLKKGKFKVWVWKRELEEGKHSLFYCQGTQAFLSFPSKGKNAQKEARGN